MNNDNLDNSNSLQNLVSNKGLKGAEELDALFDQARSVEPEILDSNFTKVVLNSLPARPVRSKKRSLVFDLVGLSLGLVVSYMFFDGFQVLDSALSLVPESLPVTVANIGSFFLAAIGIACVGWWAGERAIN